MKEKNFKNMMYILKGLALSLLLTMFSIFILSLVLLYTPFKESNIPLFNTIIMIISITIGSIYASIKIGEKGWMNGGIVGVAYFLILVLLNYLFMKSFVLDLYLTGKFILSLITGIIGGIIGINIK